ncbi:hypothetical protein [Belnapia rosea]|uniref:Uncharacterized protein n=1 Tax=Belnapia rosea TaxID=938405 RepID=A0A1G6WCJ9_9PROT|nr:hypothetical protein [Belnapia rosea]SDD63582.1 hypothetical protein SAMN04487779_1010146 [Belnapia rosea]
MTDLQKLQSLLDAGQVKLGVHIRRMNSPGSPVYRAMENVAPAAIILILSFGSTMLVHFYLGAVVLAIGCWWWLMRHLPRVKDGVFDRTAAFVLAEERNFDFWWSQGVLSLYARLPGGEERAATMRQDWRAWIRALPGTLETLPPDRRKDGD